MAAAFALTAMRYALAIGAAAIRVSEATAASRGRAALNPPRGATDRHQHRRYGDAASLVRPRRTATVTNSSPPPQRATADRATNQFLIVSTARRDRRAPTVTQVLCERAVLRELHRARVPAQLSAARGGARLRLGHVPV